MEDLAVDFIKTELEKLGIRLDRISGLEPAIAATRLVNYSAGDTLFRYGDEVDAIHVIRGGRIKLLNFLENGRARIVRLHKRGSILGLNGLLGEGHTHTAVAIDAVQVYTIPVKFILAIKNDDPEAYNHLLEYWHEYLNIADTWITDFSTGSIRGRVARLILYLAKTGEMTAATDVNLLTVEEMAEILGVTPESVSRVMADFKRNNVLENTEEESLHQFHCNLDKLEQEAAE
jgi:CRP/FNR family transcriptional regulator